MSVDITLFGATGFTGELTASYLARHLPEGASWAIAGRSRDKLDALAEALERSGGLRPEVVVADIGAESSLTLMAQGTRVLISTVGPYLSYGKPVVAAAVEAGIAYLDLTGEPQFVDEVWLAYHRKAQESGAVLVHACGFDSIPYDLGALFTVSQLPNDVPIDLTGYIHARGSFSGGTFHSAINQFGSFRESVKTSKHRRALEDRPSGRKVRGGGTPGRAEHGLEGFRVPLPTIDPQVVLRSARALPDYGPAFTYNHYAHIKKAKTLAMGGVGLGAIALGSQFGVTRNLLLKTIDPGSGPSEEVRNKNWFTLDLFAEVPGRDTLHTRVSGGDPGYGGTSQMLAEAALCLAFDEVESRTPGQSTPAVACGQALIDRLNPEVMLFTTL